MFDIKTPFLLLGLFLEFAIFSTNIYAALPLKKAAEQHNTCRQEFTLIA